jgi:hypothetical protein
MFRAQVREFHDPKTSPSLRSRVTRESGREVRGQLVEERPNGLVAEVAQNAAG